MEEKSPSSRKESPVKSQFNNAFTLLEVLVTTAIISIGLTFIFRSFTTALAASKLSNEILSACYLAEDKAWQLEQLYCCQAVKPDLNPPPAETNSGLNCSYEISDTESRDLKKLKLVITFGKNEREARNLDFLTYLKIPQK